MAKAYTKEFLVEAALSKYLPLGKDKVEGMRTMYEETYDKFGKERFRQLTALDAEAIRTFKASQS